VTEWISQFWNGSAWVNSQRVTNTWEAFVTGVTGKINAEQVFTLAQAFPNPFNSQTIIFYAIASRSHVTLKIYDMLGREIAILTDEDKSPGNYIEKWSANGVASGLYFYKITAGAFTETRKLQLVK
jgi:hypothetical protein